MSHQAPFVAHIKVVPNRGRRFEHVRDLQRISRLIYENLTDTSNTTLDELNVAQPGGGQFLATFEGTYANGFAVTPQFGESPARVTVNGFILQSANNTTQHSNSTVTIISGGERFTGTKAAPWETQISNSATKSEVAALKLLIENAISVVADSSGVDLQVFRLDYKGVIWGDRGHTFPH